MPCKILERPAASARRHLASVWLALCAAFTGPALAQVPAAALSPVPAAALSPVPERLVPSALPEGWHHGAFMEIFVRSWKDSDGDGIGDLRGLTQSLDMLQQLGIRGLWLMPVTRSADGDHGYATTDYRDIEPAYGTLADFDELLRQAHARGIGIITDYVVNHSADRHPFFVQALRDPKSPFRAWYEWREIKPAGWDIWGKDPWFTTSVGSYLGTFGADMPDFNLRHAPAVAYHRDSLRFWLNRGLDGFRLDAVPHLIENSARDWNDQPESRRLTAELVRGVHRYPGRYVVCEATAEPRDYAQPQLCGGAFAFGLEKDLAPAARGDAEAIARVAEFYRTAPHTLASFVSNHDQFAGRRLWDQVEGDERAYRLAAATYLLLPGTPFIYYGEEIGMAGASGLTGDPAIRGPYSWTGEPLHAGFSAGRPYRALAANQATHHLQAQLRDPASLWHFYKNLLQLRNNRVSIARGSYEWPQAEGQRMAYQRRHGREHTLVTFNYGREAGPLVLHGVQPGQRLRLLMPARAVAGNLEVPPATAVITLGADGALLLPAQSVQVFALEP
jgi:glycosidase